MFWQIKFGKIALIRQIRLTLIMPNFRCLRYIGLDSDHESPSVLFAHKHLHIRRVGGGGSLLQKLNHS